MNECKRVPTIKIEGEWKSLFDPPVKERIEALVFPEYLPRQRWFADKTRRISATTLVGWGGLPADPSRLFFAFVKVEFANGPAEIYFVPLAIDLIDPECEAPPSHCLARLSGPAGEAWLVDAVADDDFGRGVLASIAGPEQFPMITGRVEASRTNAFDTLRGDRTIPLGARRGTASSSNSLILLGERLVLKVFRRLEPGLNPELEVGRFLTERTDFASLPRLGGSLVYHPRNGGDVTTLAILQQYVPHQGDGWTHALDELRTYYEHVLPLKTLPAGDEHEHVLSLARRPVPSEVRGSMRESLESAATLGRRTAEMHAALASRDDDSDFAPEPLDGTDLELVAMEVRTRASRAFTELKDNRQALSDSQQASVDWLLTEGAGQLDRLLSERPDTLPPAVKTRIHGDYHLGQVLRVQQDYVLVDFEGEPMRTIEERRAKSSPIRDVAGMLRSFHYAAFAAAFALAEGRGTALPRLVGWADSWQRHVGAEFLRAYLATAGSADFVPDDDHDLIALLNRYSLGKVFYELVYELNHRPEWARIPIRGAITLLGGPSEAKTAK